MFGNISFHQPRHCSSVQQQRRYETKALKMGHQFHHHHQQQQQQQQRHQATDGLLNLFTKANHDLNFVHHRLEKEFQQLYPDNANPMKLVSRIKKIQEDISTLKGQCQELLAAKQDLIDKAQRTLVENRNLVQRMQASMGISLTSEDDDAFTNFKQIIEEWTTQVRSKIGDETHDADSGDLNKLLFSAIVQSN